MTDCIHLDGEFCKKCYTPDKGCHPPLRKTTQPLCKHGMNPCCDVCHICRLEQSVDTLFKNSMDIYNQIAEIKTSIEKLRTECVEWVFGKIESQHICPCCGKGE